MNRRSFRMPDTCGRTSDVSNAAAHPAAPASRARLPAGARHSPPPACPWRPAARRPRCVNNRLIARTAKVIARVAGKGDMPRTNFLDCTSRPISGSPGREQRASRLGSSDSTGARRPLSNRYGLMADSRARGSVLRSARCHVAVPGTHRCVCIRARDHERVSRSRAR